MQKKKKIEIIINHSQVCFWENQFCGRQKEQWLLNPNHRCSCTVLKSSSSFSVCPCHLLKSKMTPLRWRLILLVLKMSALKLWGQVWYLPSLRNQNAHACYVSDSVCLILTKDSLDWWASYNELASWASALSSLIKGNLHSVPPWSFKPQESPPLPWGTRRRSALPTEPSIVCVATDVTCQISISFLPLGPLHEDTCLIRLGQLPVGTWRCMDHVYRSFHLQTMTHHRSAAFWSCVSSLSHKWPWWTPSAVKVYCTAMILQRWETCLWCHQKSPVSSPALIFSAVSTVREDISMNEHDGGL